MEAHPPILKDTHWIKLCCTCSPLIFARHLSNVHQLPMTSRHRRNPRTQGPVLVEALMEASEFDTHGYIFRSGTWGRTGRSKSASSIPPTGWASSGYPRFRCVSRSLEPCNHCARTGSVVVSLVLRWKIIMSSTDLAIMLDNWSQQASLCALFPVILMSYRMVY